MDMNTDYVADSEEEDMLVDPLFDRGNTSLAVSSIHTPDTSVIDSPGKKNSASSAFAVISQPPIAVLTASSSTSSAAIPPPPHAQVARPSAVPNTSTSNTDPPRVPGKPRPKPKARPTNQRSTEEALAAAIAAITNNVGYNNTRSLAPPREDPVAQVSSGSRSNVPNTSSVVDFSQDIAERAKIRSRAKAPAPARTKKQSVIDVIELSSSDDELSLLPSSKSKGKSKAKASSTSDTPASRKSPKRAKTVKDVEAPGSTIHTIPVPMSDFLPPSSLLPPSDPPVPSSSSLPALSHPGLAQSPPPSPPLLPAKKRKRPLMVPDDDDEGEPNNVSVTGRDSQILMPPPPPPNAAFSSRIAALPIAEDSTGQEPPKTKSKVRKKKAADDEEEDWTGDDPKPKAKRKTTKKKKTDDGGSSEPKAKAKTSAKGKEQDRVPRNIVEVVVDPPKSRSPQKLPAHGEDETDSTTETVQQSRPGLRLAEAGTKLLGLDSDDEQEMLPKSKSAAKPGRPGTKGKGKGKSKAVLSDEEEYGLETSAPLPTDETRAELSSSPPAMAPTSPKLVRAGSLKENTGHAAPSSSPDEVKRPASTKAPSSSVISTPLPRSSSVIPKTNTPMSELIRRVNSKPGAPFASPRAAYSPFTKSSKVMLKRIAPLHPNRRTPPPPPPRPPPPKKTKKQLELEEKWEMELEEEVEGWVCLGEDERAALRRAKRDAYMGFDD